MDKIESDLVTLYKEICLNVRINKGYDIGLIFEIHEELVYVSFFRGSNVIDVGVSNGNSSIFLALKRAERVVGLESFQTFFYLALEDVRLSRMEDKVTIKDYALSDREGEEEIAPFKGMSNAADKNRRKPM